MTLMNNVFAPYLHQFVRVYLEDILVYSKTLEEHIVHLRKVFDLLRKHQLYAKLSKCEIVKSNVQFLGHVVGKTGFSMDEQKVLSIKN